MFSTEIIEFRRMENEGVWTFEPSRFFNPMFLEILLNYKVRHYFEIPSTFDKNVFFFMLFLVKVRLSKGYEC